MNIAIIGGGLGGLALAQGLVKMGASVRVYERDADASSRRQGYRTSLNALGLGALEALLPKERFARIGDLEAKNVGRRFTFASAQMKLLLRRDDEDDSAWTICRPALRNLLAEDMPIVWNKRFHSLKEDTNGIDLEFTDGTTARADFVIACDGAGSDVRPLVPGAATMMDTQISSIAGVVARTAAWSERLPMNHDGAVQYLGRGGQSLFVSFCEREDKTPIILWALSQRGGIPEAIDARFHPTLKRLVAETRSDQTLDGLTFRTSRFDVPKRALWPSGRLTLLGDAAHAMPPQRGIGGNNAFEDARLLCSVIDRPDRTDVYERAMYARAKIAVAQSDEAADLCHIANPVGAVIRNTALRVVSRFSPSRANERTRESL